MNLVIEEGKREEIRKEKGGERRGKKKEIDSHLALTLFLHCQYFVEKEGGGREEGKEGGERNEEGGGLGNCLCIVFEKKRVKKREKQGSWRSWIREIKENREVERLLCNFIFFFIY